jgi:heme/copper-type cytochrome/quinol oxidase subunit 2
VSQLKDRHLVGAGVAACAVCCAPPILAFLGIAGVAATIATFVFVGVAFGLVVGAAALFAVWHRRRQNRRQVCATDPGPVDIELSKSPERSGP